MTAEPGLPTSPVHLVGIGGVGMAGLARLLHQQGLVVRGSDRSFHRLTDLLQAEGVAVHLGHDARNVPEEAKWGIRTPAVPAMNPEVERLRSRNAPVFARGDVLAKMANDRNTIAVAGAHGKTTTSAMLLHILRTCGVQAGYAIGGETAFPGCVADQGEPTAPFVVEADESDGTLMQYHPQIAVITHVEWDHVERFPTEQALLDCYRRFVRQSGAVWIRTGDEHAVSVCEGHDSVRTVGFGEDADLRMGDIHSTPEAVHFTFAEGVVCEVPLPGTHNAWNALMAIGAASEVGVDLQDAAASLKTYAGVGRRFQRKNVRGVHVIQDYAHHPTEIEALMDSVKAIQPGKIWMAFQPHRFSRTQHLLQEFAEAFREVDHLALIPVYAAFERPEQGAGSDVLAEACRAIHPEVQVWEDRSALIALWKDQVSEGDVILIAGAGDVVSMWSEI